MYSIERVERRRISALKTALPRLIPGASPSYDAERCLFYLNSLKPIIFVFLNFFLAQQPLVRQGLLFIGASRSHSNHTRYNSSGQGINPTQRPLPDNTQHSQEIGIPAPVAVRTRNPTKVTAASPGLRTCGHSNRLSLNSL